MEPIEQIIKTRADLGNSASNFLSACLALPTSVSHLTPPGSNDPTRENVLVNVRSQVEALKLIVRDIHHSEAVLNWLLNSLTPRAPINKLPAETLAHIFTIAVSSSPCCPTGSQRDALLDIPLVCKRWYQVATSSPSLWSHLDLHIGLCAFNDVPPTFNRIQSSLNRCSGLPIHLHFHGKDLQPRPAHIPQLASILEPHISHLASMHVDGKLAQNLAQALVNLHVGHGTPSTLKTLVVPDFQVYSPTQSPSWSLRSARGLSELCLYAGAIRTPLPVVELVAVLSNCPALHTLRLHNLSATDDEPVSLTPVSLPCLRVLDLKLLGRTLRESLIPAIFPGTLGLDIRVEVFWSLNIDATLVSLFERSNIAAFSIQGYFNHMQLEAYMAHIPNLRALILELSACEEAFVLDMLVALVEPGLPPPLSLLRSLCFVKAGIKSETIDRIGEMVATYNIQTLAFLSCKFPSHSDQQSTSSDEDEDESGSETGENIQEIRAQLSRPVERIEVFNIPSVLADHSMDMFVQSLIN